MQYHPYEYQKRLINTYHNYRYSISMMPRQTGKSTSAAGYLLWYAMFVPDSTILIAAHKYDGSQEIMTRVRYAYELCPDHIRAGATNYNRGSIDFENGSRIISATTTENTGRGMSITLLYADEFAFVRPGIAKEFWTSISPTLATGGKAIITSTPNSDEDQFAQIWLEANKKFDEHGNETDVGRNGFFPFRAYWNEHAEFLKIASKKKVLVKAVVTPATRKEDVEKAIHLIKQLHRGIPFILQPASPVKSDEKDIGREKLFDFLETGLRNNLTNIRVIPQIHKILKVK